MFLRGSKQHDHVARKNTSALCLFLESFPMSGVSPDSLQDEGNAPSKNFHKRFCNNNRLVQPTVHLCSMHEPFEMIRFEINDVLNLS
jgi:hypothetical protein